MRSGETGAAPEKSEQQNRRWAWKSRMPWRRHVLYGVVLVSLAVGSTWLVQRWDAAAEAKRQAVKNRSLIELVGQAVGPSVSVDDSHRIQRLLESSMRGTNILAGAVLDSAGTVIAHTDISKTGDTVDVSTWGQAPGESFTTKMSVALFDGMPGRGISQPLLGAGGATGAIALIFPAHQPDRSAVRFLLYLLPAGLVILAFLGITMSTIRSALKPTSDLLERLCSAANGEGSSPRAGTPPQARYDTVVESTVSRIQALTADNDELLLTNRLLKYENKRMKTILDSLPDGVIVVNSTGKPIYANQRAMRTLGLPVEEARGWTPENPPQELLRLLAQADKSGHAMIPVTAGIAERQVLLSRIPLAAHGDQAAGVLYSARDMTAQQAANQAQAEFLSQITHELKAPLNTIVAYVEELAEDSGLTLEERKEYFNTLNSEATRMAKLISNLLQMSRIQMGNLSANLSMVKPVSLIREQAESLILQAEDRGLTLEVNISENLPPVHGDKDLLGVAVNNLISNAIKYTQPGGKISVRAMAVDGGVRLEVKDTGIGIPTEIRTRIFERFFRSDQELVQERAGSGLGLSLVKEIVEIHKGRIFVESEVGRGSKFFVWLPCRKVSSRLETAEALT